MSLQGSLDTFALPDVLVLLASTNKTGELQVSGSRAGAAGHTIAVEGRLWLDAGRLVGSDVPRVTEAADAVFELLRLGEGVFSFTAGPVSRPGTAIDIEPVLGEAEGRLAEWREIERFVPSLASWLVLASEAPSDHVSLRGDQWRLVAAVGGGCPVSGVIDRLDVGELSGCRAVKELVEAGLVRIGEASSPGSDPANPDATTSDATTSDTTVLAATASGDDMLDGPAMSDSPMADGGTDDDDLPDWRAELGDVQDLDSLASLPHRTRRFGTDHGPDWAHTGQAEAQGGAGEPDAGEPAPAGTGSDEADDGEEPLNRGLLLKFLSSVRN